MARSPSSPSSAGARTRARRAVIVGGVRTPFVKAFTDFTKMDTVALGDAAVGALLERFPIPRTELDALIWGGVILPGNAPNVGREIVLDLKLGAHVEAMTCTRACASGLQAVTLAAAAIERGEADIVVAGGSDSTSNAEIKLPQKWVHALAPLALGGKPKAADYLAVLAQLMPITELVPARPRIAERTTGEVMGEAAEKMATRNEIGRAEQDEFAARSHHRAAAAIASGRFDEEVCTVTTPDGGKVYADGLVRADTSVEKLARLRPVFAREGTLSAGNSSPLTDGAAAVLLMSEDKARALGFTPRAALRSWAYSGVDPADQLLMGPALAMPKALARAGLSLADVDFVDMHEAFAAQVLSILKMLGSDAFARERLGRDKAVGTVGSGATQRERWLSRARAPLRGDGCPHGHDDDQRARPQWQRDGAAGHLRGRRPRGGGRSRAHRLTWSGRAARGLAPPSLRAPLARGGSSRMMRGHRA